MPKKKKSPLDELVEAHQADPDDSDFEGGKVRQVIASLGDGQEDEVEGPSPEEVAEAVYSEEQLAPVERPSGEMYRPRKMASTGLTDVETLRSCSEDEIPALLSGYPGCGKTAMIEAAFGEDLYTVEGHGDMEVSDLVGSWHPIKEDILRNRIVNEVGKQKKLSKKDLGLVVDAARQLPAWGGPPQPVNGPEGELIEALELSKAIDDSLLISAPEDNLPAQVLLEGWRRAGNSSEYEWRDGPLVKAMKEGKPLFVDDITIIPAPVLLRLYPAMDGRKTIRVIEHGGEAVKAEPGFFVLGAHNPGAPGAILSEALSSRFLVQFEVESDLNLALELGVARSVVRAARNMRKRRREGSVTWAPEMRELLAYQKVCNKFGRKAAADNLVGVAPPEAREAMIEALGNTFPGVEAMRLSEES